MIFLVISKHDSLEKEKGGSIEIYIKNSKNFKKRLD